METKVSVNICCYNGDQFIRETIESILKQTFNNFEIIVIDDGSKDKTGEIIKSFSDSRIKYYYQENKGLSASRNRAIELSCGEYIALLDQDDLWEPEKLKLQVDILNSNPNIGLVYSDVYFVDENGFGNNRFFMQRKPQSGWITKSLIAGNLIPCPTVIIRRNLLNEETSLFRLDLHIVEEYELFLRLSLITEFEYINKPLAKYRLHEGNTSKNLENRWKEELLILNEFSKKVSDHTLIEAIEKRLSRNYLILYLYYISYKHCSISKKEILQIARKIDNRIIRCILYILYYFPTFINRCLFLFLRKMKYLLDKIRK